MKNIIGNLTLLGFSLLIVFLIGEVASRYISPISPGPSILDLEGNKATFGYMEPGQRFRIITPDFDAVTGITKDGYREPEAQGNPEVIFIGDSFTYAQGVEDYQTFPAIYCKQQGISCANLGVPGASTLYEINRLESFLKSKNWRPKTVNFFFFTGNDFSDNLDAAAKRSKGLPYEPAELNPSAEEDAKGLVESIIDFGLKHSNLLRVAYYKVLPTLRKDPEAVQQSLNKALTITQQEFKRLDDLSKQYGFKLNLFVIYPEPEITHGVYRDLGKKLQALTSRPLIHLAELFSQDTQTYFFPADGHFSVAGNKKLAAYLIERDKK